ncbi:hypothetical protein AGLY_014401 [Aphis glycines]|uniref:Uncharacterized protein n=1 Tax=Aphis glycines TaxID=307491 RepID=A0A6G0T3K1_APHGL|nr:hypothetical protein AGLY_014401 [Aphis glycines]
MDTTMIVSNIFKSALRNYNEFSRWFPWVLMEKHYVDQIFIKVIIDAKQLKSMNNNGRLYSFQITQLSKYYIGVLNYNEKILINTFVKHFKFNYEDMISLKDMALDNWFKILNEISNNSTAPSNKNVSSFKILEKLNEDVEDQRKILENVIEDVKDKRFKICILEKEDNRIQITYIKNRVVVVGGGGKERATYLGCSKLQRYYIWMSVLTVHFDCDAGTNGGRQVAIGSLTSVHGSLVVSA